MIVLDASVLIALLNAHDAHHQAAKEIFAQSFREELGVNSLTLAEVLVSPLRSGKPHVVQSALDDLEVRELLFPVGASIKLAALRVSTGMRMPDCCVVLAAEESQSSIASFDDQLTQAARERGLTVHSR